MPRPFFEIEYYHDYISPSLAEKLLAQAQPSPVADLVFCDRLQKVNGSLETPEALEFLSKLYQQVQIPLAKVLKQRQLDRDFIDQRVRACYEFNQQQQRDFLSPHYKTILGLEDSSGRVVVGPLAAHYCHNGGRPVAEVPTYLQGAHVTLFGPPDSAKMAINAMNAYHRKLKGEPEIIEKLLSTHTSVPKWGADDEDSKTPLHQDLVEAGTNLTACFEKNLKLQEGDKHYQLASEKLSLPIKRFPGLALPCTFLFYKKNPIPLHLYDFALHLFRNWHNAEALCFYVPKLENEEEAKYIHHMISCAEKMIQALHPNYKLGTVRLMIVLENPRAILRVHEIMDALHPYFVGASLGWHDYLASTARLFKEDANYRIPVKADPDIVIKYIKASHLLLADVVGSRGGIKVGGMYGILPMRSELSEVSFQVTLKGFFKDVITQLKRDLTGFWVAHPDFVRIGLAIIEAWKFYQQGQKQNLIELTSQMLQEPYRTEVLAFIAGPDIVGLNKNDPNYERSLLVADIKESDYIANNHPDEIRYNVFQSLQYLTDWLSGNGCVALPTTVNGMAVRVMDDLATAERSRWEVWHEIYHNRFSIEDFIKTAHEEMHFIRKDLSTDKKIVQVKWDERTAKWYPIALHLMIQLMTQKNPVEFATELLMPFTIDDIRQSDNPLQNLQQIDPQKYQLDPYVERLHYYFENCGCLSFAQQMAQGALLDTSKAREIIMSFTVEEIIEAASFHGNIGESKKTLDAKAAAEQNLVKADANTLELQKFGKEYLNKFSFKFLISAKDKTPGYMLEQLKQRLGNNLQQEIQNAKLALNEITQKRFVAHPLDQIQLEIQKKMSTYQIMGLSITVSSPGFSFKSKLQSGSLNTQDFLVQDLYFGQASANQQVSAKTHFEVASLSKTLASAFAHEYFAQQQIALTTPVNSILRRSKAKFLLTSSVNPEWAEQVTIQQLMNHTALNMHYVNGLNLQTPMPSSEELLLNPKKHSYPTVDVLNKPGSVFGYSGGGFLVLEYLIETIERKPIWQTTQRFFENLGLKNLTFAQHDLPGKEYAQGHFDDGKTVEHGRLQFPAFAAGALGNSSDMQNFLNHLTAAYHNLEGSAGLSHDTAVQMLFAQDHGAKNFMASLAGYGVFVAEAGENKIILHQGANEGFRALYLHCISGPDCGKGFTIFCNNDNKAVLFISEVSQLLLQYLKVSGIDFNSFDKDFNFQNLPQEQIVNLGYKQLIFKNFLPTTAIEIPIKGRYSAYSEYNLAVGAKVVNVTNQRFARAENLASPFEPVFDPDLFCSQGKVMDSWETARHNYLEYDSLELALTKTSAIRYLRLSTEYHDGNQGEFVRLLGKVPKSQEWIEFLPKTKMQGHSYLQIDLQTTTPEFSHIRVDMFPDGGLTRLGLFLNLPDSLKKDFVPLKNSQCLRFSHPIPKSRKPLTIPYKNEQMNTSFPARTDWASLANGGKILRASNEHYGPAAQVISPFIPLHMFDGLESARSRKSGHSEEVEIQLGKSIAIDEIIFDFTYFVNNNPRSLDVEIWQNKQWQAIATNLFVKPYAGNKLKLKVTQKPISDRLRIRTIPDGGINRVHVYEAKLLT